MPYLGNGPATAYTSTTKDSFSGDGSTTNFTMSKPATTTAVRVVVENVVQNPAVAYSCGGTSLTFTSAPPAGTNNIYVVHLGPPAATIAPPTTINNNTTFTGNLTIGGTSTNTGLITASAGVAIGGTGASNTLDDYEEGTWTPVMTGDGGSAGSASTTVYGAAYTKIGNLVTAMCYIRWANIGSYSGNAAITGLPFTSANNSLRTQGNITFLKRTELVDAFMYSGNIVANTSVVQINRISSDQNTKLQAQVSYFNDALNEIIFNCTYNTA